MADTIEVHFKRSDNTELRAVVEPASAIKGVLLLPKGPPSGMGLTRSSFAQAHELVLRDPATTLPAALKVKRKDKEEIVSFTAGDEGPGVCYWVGNELICW
jgi:hypothetical protein